MGRERERDMGRDGGIEGVGRKRGRERERRRREGKRQRQGRNTSITSRLYCKT